MPDASFLEIRGEASFIGHMSLLHEAARPDLVVLDVILPWGHPLEDEPPRVIHGAERDAGPRCLRLLRESDLTKETPVVVYSVLRSAEFTINTDASTRYVWKDSQVDELTAEVADLLGLCPQQAQADEDPEEPGPTGAITLVLGEGATVTGPFQLNTGSGNQEARDRCSRARGDSVVDRRRREVLGIDRTDSRRWLCRGDDRPSQGGEPRGRLPDEDGHRPVHQGSQSRRSKYCWKRSRSGTDRSRRGAALEAARANARRFRAPYINREGQGFGPHPSPLDFLAAPALQP